MGRSPRLFQGGGNRSDNANGSPANVHVCPRQSTKRSVSRLSPQSLTGDQAFHNLLDRPREAPWRTAVGTALLTWVLTIFLAGSADRVYVAFGISYVTQIWVYRVLVWVLPLVALLVTKRVCDELRAREHVERQKKLAEAGVEPVEA